MLSKSYLDNIFGAILSQAIIVPFTSVFITAFQLGWKSKLAFGLYFAMVEKLFLKLGIFHNYWWKTVLTGTLIPIYFFISDIWYKWLQKRVPAILSFSLFNCILVTRINILYTLAVLGKLRFGFGCKRSWKEHFIIAPLYSIGLSIFGTWSIKRNGFWSKIRFLFVVQLLDSTLKKLNLLKVFFRHPVQGFLLHTAVLISAIQYKKLIYQGERPKGSSSHNNTQK